MHNSHLHFTQGPFHDRAVEGQLPSPASFWSSTGSSLHGQAASSALRNLTRDKRAHACSCLPEEWVPARWTWAAGGCAGGWVDGAPSPFIPVPTVQTSRPSFQLEDLQRRQSVVHSFQPKYGATSWLRMHALRGSTGKFAKVKHFSSSRNCSSKYLQMERETGPQLSKRGLADSGVFFFLGLHWIYIMAKQMMKNEECVQLVVWTTGSAGLSGPSGEHF